MGDEIVDGGEGIGKIWFCERKEGVFGVSGGRGSWCILEKGMI